MSRRRRTALKILAGAAVVAAGVGGYLVYATQRVRPFYAAAIQADPHQLKSAGRRMERRVAKLARQAASFGLWQSVFTEDEVNGWLALYLEKNKDKFLPPEVADPRLAFVDGGVKIGFRYLGKRFDSVISLEADAFMVAEDVAAVRLRKAYLGMLPLAMDDVVKQISKGAASLGLPIRWTTQDDDPVLLLAVADALSTDEELRQLEQLELREGEIRLAGKTEPRVAMRQVTPVQAAAGR
jgi:hypothetical protein